MNKGSEVGGLGKRRYAGTRASEGDVCLEKEVR